MREPDAVKNVCVSVTWMYPAIKHNGLAFELHKAAGPSNFITRCRTVTQSESDAAKINADFDGNVPPRGVISRVSSP